MVQSAFFFDFDGTLIDSRADLVATVNHTRRDLGLAPKLFDEILSYVGRGAKKLLESSIPEAADSKEELLGIFLSHYGEHMLEKVTLYPFVRQTLEELARRGHMLGINTAKPSFAVHAILEHLAIRGFFGDAIIAGGDAKEMKPSAVPLLECAKKMNGHVLAERDWMVGDNWTDIDCAKNAGTRSVFCSYGFGRLFDSHPTKTISSFVELLDLE